MTALASALASRYPQLTASQRERLETVTLREIAAAIAQGNEIAIIRPLPGGSFEISTLAVEHADAHPTQQGTR